MSLSKTLYLLSTGSTQKDRPNKIVDWGINNQHKQTYFGVLKGTVLWRWVFTLLTTL